MLNKVILMGRLTRDPEMRQTPSGTAVCAFSLAVERSHAKQGEERQVDFINVTAFGKTAEFVQRYFSKGQLAALSGRIQTRKWTDDSGQNHIFTEVVAEEMFFTGDKKSSAAAPQESGFAPQSNGFAPQNGGFAPQSSGNGFAPVGFSPDDGDDIDFPF